MDSFKTLIIEKNGSIRTLFVEDNNHKKQVARKRGRIIVRRMVENIWFRGFPDNPYFSVKEIDLLVIREPRWRKHSWFAIKNGGEFCVEI